MIRYKNLFVLCLVATLLTMSPLSSFATDVDIQLNRAPADPAGMLIDLVLARPLGLVVTIAGSAIFVVSLPFSLLGGNTDDAWESLVVSPAEYTFERPLGEFE